MAEEAAEGAHVQVDVHIVHIGFVKKIEKHVYDTLGPKNRNLPRSFFFKNFSG